ncbi:MAG TPA: hypothetical protein VGP63_03870 [Planctomycetaceae bacterium]|nr:hypothetical protein [Planctomycetaceae bacterium]
MGDYSNFGFGETVQLAQLQVVNPAVVMIFAPLFAWLFKALDPRGRIFSAGNKILAGFVFSVAASATMAIAALLATGLHAAAGETPTKVSLAWPVMALVFLTISEILIYGTGLEYAYAAAPKTMKGFVTGCFLALDAVANFVDAWAARLYGGSLVDPVEKRGPLSALAFFSLSALVVLGATVAFAFIARKMNREMRSSDTAKVE